MTLSRIDSEVALESPLLVMGLEGWVDAGLSGANAMSALIGAVPTETIATFDADLLVDQRSRRPIQRIVDGVLDAVTWPEIQLRHGADARGNDILFLVGPEPDYRWREFTKELVRLAGEFDVRLAVALGGFPAPMPHTRPTRIIATAVDQVMANDVGFIPGTREVPAGIHAALIKGLGEAGVPALSLWAMVPHYLSGMPYPQASVGLIDQLSRLADISVEATELRSAADVTRQRIDELIAQNADHVAMVAGLEQQVDAEATSSNSGDHPPMDLDNLPSGDEIAAELQRFLREQGQA